MDTRESEWIVADAAVLGGKPCIDGSRISIAFILELLASGASIASIHEAYPQLPVESISAAVSFAARSLKNEVDWEITVIPQLLLP
jgi:uncharacterized protein (DUF433 family)